MTALIITGAILFILAALLLSPVSVEASVKGGSATVHLHYLFLRFSLWPGDLTGKRKKKDKGAKKAAKKEKDSAAETLEKPATATVQTVMELIRNSRQGLRTIRRHLVFSRVRIYVCVAAGDAHQTALRYTQISCLAAAALDVAGTLFVLRKPKVGILPDFTGDETRYEVALRAGIRPLFALLAGGHIFFRFLLSQRGKDVKQAKTTVGVSKG